VSDDGVRALEYVFVAADHHRQRAILCAGLSAGDGRIEDADALFLAGGI